MRRLSDQPEFDRVVICGSRNFGNEQMVREFVNGLRYDLRVVVGGATGPDTFAERAARDGGLEVEVHDPDWKSHGKRAGIMRNLAMLDTKPIYVLAFWDGESRGTRHTITEAQRRGIPVLVVRPDGSASVTRDFGALLDSYVAVGDVQEQETAT